LKLCESDKNLTHENITAVLIILFRDDAGEYNFENSICINLKKIILSLASEPYLAL
jgi:hypothetical protein